jgi:hypothetical protein
LALTDQLSLVDNVKLNKYVTNFDAPDAHFDYSSLFSDAQVKKVGNPRKKKKKKRRYK